MMVGGWFLTPCLGLLEAWWMIINMIVSSRRLKTMTDLE